MSTHEPTKSFRKTKDASDRSFGIIFTVAFALIGLAPLIGGHQLRWWALVIAAVFAAVTIFNPKILAPLKGLWMKLALLLHRITNPIIMGLIFFLVIVPIGVVMRIRGKDPLQLRWQNEASTYWIRREPSGPQHGSMSKQF